ncbi:unnamed protein product [Rotaria magnacalcarata]|uniref:Carboxylesterase type B domain-containing protein n=1 Tax=Rotaria magnacalcarata TaxID=392030 RepID=A0A816A3H1_9BILA|nr:unnamed protein product [Rotaria magnacalcarata]CAF4020986.1 unnamed protein product [Rotaria magnacalcarata]
MITYIISTLPQATSLISRAISESGSGILLATSAQQIENGNTLVNALGCSNANDVGTCLRMKSIAAINNATPVVAPMFIYLPTQFYAHVGGKIIPVQPINTSPKVSYMAGTCTMEGTLFAAGSFSNPLAVTYLNYVNYLNTTFGAAYVPSILATYPISMFNSTSSPALFVIAAVITDAEYTCPTRRALRTSLGTKLSTYTYLWNHVPTCPWTPSLTMASVKFLGATHTNELAFVFGETTCLPQPNGTCQLSAGEQILSREIVAAWQSMAVNGYPTTSNGTTWPSWVSNGRGARFDASLTFTTINNTLCNFWDTIQQDNPSSANLLPLSIQQTLWMLLLLIMVARLDLI